MSKVIWIKKKKNPALEFILSYSWTSIFFYYYSWLLYFSIILLFPIFLWSPLDASNNGYDLLRITMVRYCSRYFLYMNSFHSYRKPRRWMLLLSHFRDKDISLSSQTSLQSGYRLSITRICTQTDTDFLCLFGEFLLAYGIRQLWNFPEAAFQHQQLPEECSDGGSYGLIPRFKQHILELTDLLGGLGYRSSAKSALYYSGSHCFLLGIWSFRPSNDFISIHFPVLSFFHLKIPALNPD